MGSQSWTQVSDFTFTFFLLTLTLSDILRKHVFSISVTLVSLRLMVLWPEEVYFHQVTQQYSCYTLDMVTNPITLNFSYLESIRQGKESILAGVN